MNIYKFSSNATEKAPELAANELIDRMKTGNRYDFGIANIMYGGVYKIQGWAFDLREELTLYLIKQYGTWHEIYAPNRTSLRKLTYGRIDAIKEI